MHRKKRRWSWAGVIIGCSAVVVGCGASNNPTVAQAGTVRIKKNDVIASIKANQVLQGALLPSGAAAQKSQAATLAQQAIIVQWARAHHLLIGSPSATQWIREDLVKSLGGSAVLHQRLSRYRVTSSALQHYVANQLALQQVFNQVTKNVALPATSAEERYYRKNAAFFVSPAEALVRDITVPSRQQADSLRQQLQHGASFAALAQRDSRDGYASQGGSRGWISLGAGTSLPASWLNAVKRMKPSSMSIVTSSLGYSIIEVQASRAGAEIPFHAVEPAIQSELMQSAKEQAFNQWAAPIMAANRVRLLGA